MLSFSLTGRSREMNAGSYAVRRHYHWQHLWFGNPLNGTGSTTRTPASDGIRGRLGILRSSSSNITRTSAPTPKRRGAPTCGGAAAPSAYEITNSKTPLSYCEPEQRRVRPVNLVGLLAEPALAMGANQSSGQHPSK